MAFVSRTTPNLLKLREACVKIPSACTQYRWRKPPARKPKWMPTAPSKLFRIPVHPEVPPDEKELIMALHDEYYRKIESMRVLFQEELALKNKDDGNTLENIQKEEEKFQLLLEENKRENERVKAIREAAFERLFQEKQIEILQLEEDRKLQEQETKMRVEEMVRREKEKRSICISSETLDHAIEHALENPINISFCVDVSGNIKFEGKPPVEFEEEIKQKIAQSRES